MCACVSAVLYLSTVPHFASELQFVPGAHLFAVDNVAIGLTHPTVKLVHLHVQWSLGVASFLQHTINLNVNQSVN